MSPIELSWTAKNGFAEKGRAVQISAFFELVKKVANVVDLLLYGEGKKWQLSLPMQCHLW